MSERNKWLGQDLLEPGLKRYIEKTEAITKTKRAKIKKIELFFERLIFRNWRKAYEKNERNKFTSSVEKKGSGHETQKKIGNSKQEMTEQPCL